MARVGIGPTSTHSFGSGNETPYVLVELIPSATHPGTPLMATLHTVSVPSVLTGGILEVISLSHSILVTVPATVRARSGEALITPLAVGGTTVSVGATTTYCKDSLAKAMETPENGLSENTRKTTTDTSPPTAAKQQVHQIIEQQKLLHLERPRDRFHDILVVDKSALR